MTKPKTLKSAGDIPKSKPKPIKGNVAAACTPNTVPSIPASWRTLGAETGYNPPVPEALRFWIVGPSGEGKTTFINSMPNTVILDFDDGASTCPGSKAIRIKIRNYEHYMEVTEKLIEEGKAGKHTWMRVCIDTVEEWAGMIINQLQDEKNVEDITDYGAQGAGWNMIKTRCWSRLRALEEAGYSWALAGHLHLKDEINPVDKKPRTVLRDTIFPSFSRKITGRSHFKLTIYSAIETKSLVGPNRKTSSGKILPGLKKTVKEAKHYCNIRTTEEMQNKARGVPDMPQKFALPMIDGWETFKMEYNKAVKIAKEKYK
jgi:hypothetical protein